MLYNFNCLRHPVTGAILGSIDVRVDTEGAPPLCFSVTPADSLAGRPAEVVAAAQALWTPDVLAAWDAWIAEITPPPEPPAARWEVRKLLVLDRLVVAGHFDAAMVALGGPGQIAYERWSAAQTLASDDAQVIALLEAIGADPEAILAAE